MKLENTNKAALESTTKTVNYNARELDMALFFEYIPDPTSFIPVGRSDVLNFTYIDDIGSVYLTGTLQLNNPTGYYSQVLSALDSYRLGVYIHDKELGYKENIYFSIIKTTTTAASTTSTEAVINLSLIESFAADAASRSVSLLINRASASVKPPTNTTLAEVAKYCYDLLKVDLAQKIEFQGDTACSSTEPRLSQIRTIGLDERAIQKTAEASDDISLGFSLINNARQTSLNVLSLMTLLHTCGSYPDSESDFLGSPITFRSENVTTLPRDTIAINTDGSASTSDIGARRLVLRDLRETFKNCFNNQGHVYEYIGVDPTHSANNYQAKFFTSTNVLEPGSISYYPLPRELSDKEWANIAIRSTNLLDGPSQDVIWFYSVLEHFVSKYLYNTAITNINEIVANYRFLDKNPPFDNDELDFVVTSKMIRSFFTINNMVKMILPGQLCRKANELVYIDKNCFAYSVNSIGGFKIGYQTNYGGSIQDNYYYVTRVIHQYNQNKYMNTMYLCGFASDYTTVKK